MKYYAAVKKEKVSNIKYKVIWLPKKLYGVISFFFKE